MQAATIDAVKIPVPKRRKQAVPNGVLGMIVFVIAETMFFAGMISAFIIVKTQAVGGVWPPLGQPRLPVEATAFNTGVLLLSGVALGFARSHFKKGNTVEERNKAKLPLLAAFGLATFFLIFQGTEWVQLMGAGLSFTISAHGSFFYFIVGTHALHTVAAVLGLAFCIRKLFAGTLRDDELWTAQIFFYFVVGMWPLLYWQVYLP
ncbi:MAG: hypothetical protein GY822_15480 [Deltaproteobacteria bacterium]|nr:hypothetical protein [Deltaproteobacteria bacterium]